MANCTHSDAYIAFGNGVNKFAYNYVLHIYLPVGLGSNIILLAAFYRQAKTQQAYTYQVILTVSKTLEVLCFGFLLVATYNFTGYDFFEKTYLLVWAYCRLSFPGHVWFICCSLLCTVAMSADRVFALSRPFVYKNINHKKHQIVAALFCVAIPAPIAMGWIYFAAIVLEGDRYRHFLNQEYVQQWYPRIMGGTIEVILRTICCILLVGLNVTMISKFRKQKNKTIGQGISDQKETQRKAAERTITLLNFYQSVLMCFNQFPHVFLHILIYAAPDFSECHRLVTFPLADSAIMITDTFDLFFILIINQKLRQLIFDMLRCKNN